MVSLCLKQDSIYLRLIDELEDLLLTPPLYIDHQDIDESESFKQKGVLYLYGQCLSVLC